MKSLVVLVGPIASGKTTLASLLADRLSLDILGARQLILAATGQRTLDRETLQMEGVRLELARPGEWLAVPAQEALDRASRGVVVDSARTKAQVESLLRLEAETHVIFLEANESTRRKRYERREQVEVGGASFETASHHLVEQAIPALATLADVRIDTSKVNPESLFVVVAGLLQGGAG